MTQHSDQLDQLAAALAKAQSQVMGAAKTSSNPFFKSKYADLGSVWDACREAFTRNGLSVAQFPGFENGVATLTTYLLHVSGQWISGVAGAPITKQDSQGVGSAISYLRRYALAAVAGVVQEDDDGNDASGKTMQYAKARTGPAESTAAPASKSGGSPPVPPVPLDQRPPALDKDTGEILPWEEIPMTADTPFPGDDKGNLKGLAVKDWPLAHLRWCLKAGKVPGAPGGTEVSWLGLVRDELKRRDAPKALEAP